MQCHDGIVEWLKAGPGQSPRPAFSDL